MAQNHFHGHGDFTAVDMQQAGLVFAVSLGRRAPLHRMHVDCINEIIAAGLTPVIVIGSANTADSALYDPMRNPLTVEQQIDQLRLSCPDIDFSKVKILTLEDNLDDGVWMDNFVKTLKQNGVYDKAVIHFRSKASDAEKMNDTIKPMSQFSLSFIEKGLAVWHSFNKDKADDAVCATEIRGYDLANLNDAQKAIVSSPEYLVKIAAEARNNNPDKAVLEQYNIPLTMLDLSLARLYNEAGVSTAEIVKTARENGDVTIQSVTEAAYSVLRQKQPQLKAANNNETRDMEKKPLLVIGNSASLETADILKNSGLFETSSKSLEKFQSNEPFVEFFYDDRDNVEVNAQKIKGAKAYVVQSTLGDVDTNVMNLLRMIHTLKWHGAAEVHVICPFSAFSRQDRAFKGRLISVGADMLPKLLKSAGADSVTTFSMHSQAGINFYKEVFGGNFKSLSAAEIFSDYIKKKFFASGNMVVIGAPDGADKLHDEGQRRARELSESLTGAFNRAAMFFVTKEHKADSVTKIAKFEGDVAGKDCIIVDDMIDGGGTMLNTAIELKKRGAKSVTCLCTHGILTKGNTTALEKLMIEKVGLAYAIDNLVMTDAVPEAAEKIAEFSKNYPELAKKVEMLPLGHAILAEIKKQTAPAVKPTSDKAAPGLQFARGTGT